MNCHPEEGFSPTKDLLFAPLGDVALLPTNRRSRNCAATRLRFARDDKSKILLNLSHALLAL
jgi:hypothetical protein